MASTMSGHITRCKLTKRDQECVKALLSQSSLGITEHTTQGHSGKAPHRPWAEGRGFTVVSVGQKEQDRASGFRVD